MPYVCSNCRREIKTLETGRVRCPHCRSRIIIKARPGVVRTVRAR